MRVGIVAQRDNDAAVTLAEEVLEALPTDVSAVVDPETGRHLDWETRPIEEFHDLELVVSIGGDGTFLFAARHAGSTPVAGVNLGEVGFLNAVAPDDAIAVIQELINEYQTVGSVTATSLPRLTVHGTGTSVSPAINEIVVQGPQRGSGYGIDVEIYVDGEQYAETHADGVLVATPAGSTAYNLSEGGPLITPTSAVFVVTPMSAASATRPLVVPESVTIAVTVTGADAAIALSDGRDATEFEPPATVEIEAAPNPARVAGPGVEFFEALGKLE